MGRKRTEVAEKCLKLYLAGKKPKEISEILRKQGIYINSSEVHFKIKHFPEYKAFNSGEVLKELADTIDSEMLLGHLTKNTLTLGEMSKKFGVAEKVLLETIQSSVQQGYQIEFLDEVPILNRIIVPKENVFNEDWDGKDRIIFGLCGDNQSGSKYTQITFLHKYYDLCAKEGVPVIYHTGDITEGEEMRQGHKYECYIQGADAHLEEIRKNYPQRKGIVTKFITGNHDHSLIKRAGYDIGTAIAKEREDMIYLGQGYATINLMNDLCPLDLYHPIDGTAYALSYKIQKAIDGMQGGSKPKILAVGHYHKSEYLPIYRNIHAFQTGCFQAQTPFMRGNKYISAHVGGWIIEIYVEKDGTINRCKAEFVPFYKMIKDDYLNWR